MYWRLYCCYRIELYLVSCLCVPVSCFRLLSNSIPVMDSLTDSGKLWLLLQMCFHIIISGKLYEFFILELDQWTNIFELANIANEFRSTYLGMFLKNDVSVSDLPFVTDEQFHRMNITKIGHINRIRKVSWSLQFVNYIVLLPWLSLMIPLLFHYRQETMNVERRGRARYVNHFSLDSMHHFFYFCEENIFQR